MREIQGQYTGVGVGNFLRDDSTGEYYFLPLRNSPAAKAGLRFGDRIVAIGDQDVSKLSLVDITELLRGTEDTTVTVKIRPRSAVVEYISPNEVNGSSSQESKPQTDKNELQEITITRGIVQREVVTGDRLDPDG